MKSTIEIRNQMDKAIDTYLTSRLEASTKQSFSNTELDQIYQHYYNFINTVHEIIIKKEAK